MESIGKCGSLPHAISNTSKPGNRQVRMQASRAAAALKQRISAVYI